MAQHEEEMAELICQRWVAEFDCKFVWKKILETRSFDGHIQYLLNGLLERFTLSGLQNHPLWIGKDAYFFSLLASLAEIQSQNSLGEKDGAFTLDAEEENDVEASVQNKLLLVLDKLTDVCSTDAIKDALPEVRQHTLLQCVFVFCRSGRYKEAEMFFSARKTEFDKENRRKAEAVIFTQKNQQPHRLLASESWKDYIEMMLQFLEIVRETFQDPPFLLQLAQDFKTLPSPYKKMTETAEDIGPISDGDSDGLDMKLAAVRKKVRKQVQQKVGGLSDRLGTPTKRSSSDARGKSQSPKKRPTTQRENRGREDSVSESGSRDSEENRFAEFDSDLDDLDPGSSRSSTRRPAYLPSVRVRRSLAPQAHSQRPRRGFRVKWAEREEEEFYLMVQKYGVGSWKEIKEAWSTDRTGVMLKDKWRTILKTNYNELCEKFGPVDH